MVWVMLAWLPAAMAGSWAVNVLAQDPSSTWIEVVRPFGIAAPFAILCLVGVKLLWEENRRLLTLLLEAAPALAESNKALAENTETLASVTVIMHSLSGRPALDMTELAIIKRMLREWDERPHR